MEDLFSMNNILSDEEASALFGTEEDDSQRTEETPSSEEEEKENNTTEATLENLFGETPESVGSRGTSSSEDDSTSQEEADSNSPDNNDKLYSSMAGFLVEDGVFPDFDDTEIENIKGPQDFSDMIKKVIESRLDETQKRVNEALNNGVEPSAIQQYESAISYLDSIDDKAIEAENADGEDLRRRLIYRDLINKRTSPERAKKMLDRIFAAGDDIAEAKEALAENKKFFTEEYDRLRNEAAREAEEERKAENKKRERLKKSLLETEKVFGGLEVDKSIRQKAYENLSTPIWKDPETGEYLTAIQKFRHDDEEGYMKFVSLMYTLTDGGKNLDRIVKPAVNKETKKKMKDIEQTLRNSAAGRSGGKMSFVSTGNAPSRNKGTLLDNGYELDI